MNNMDKYLVPFEKLKRICNFEEELDFCKTSLDASPLEGVIGQHRAVKSMEFGLNVNAPGYNIFVVGPTGTGKTTYTQAVVTRAAAKGRVPDDWCYINNFTDPDKPIAVSLPAGQGRIFQDDMEELISYLKVSIPKAFESSDYEQQKDNIIQAVQEKMEQSFHSLEDEAQKAGFSVKQMPTRFIFVPMKADRPLSPEEYDKLSVQERMELDEKGHKLEKKLDETFRNGQLLEKKAKEEIEELEKHIVNFAVGPKITKLKEKYEKHPKIIDYLEAVLADITENHTIFRGQGTAQMKQSVLGPVDIAGDEFEPYSVNLFINNEKTVGAPVVIEPNPYYYNVFGKIEYKNQMYSMSTNFSMVKAGALHRANGGYLILQAKDVLMDPFAWDTLKKALKYGNAVVENIGEQYRFVPTETLRPEPIPLDIKIILIGSPMLFYYLGYDEDFQKLFKVKVDFDIEMPRNKENIMQYASFVSNLCNSENLKHFNVSGLARVIEYGSRLAEDQNKLSTRFNELNELVYEATVLAQSENAEFVEAHHVDKAIKHRRYRSNRIEEKIQEMIIEGKIIINTEGAVVGQINGLSVIQLGGYSFGQPSRITARTYTGRGGIINIERETEMSGSIHSKGVMTLTGYLGGKFAQKKPLALTAQITFEQSYEGVDGDSASSAELYAILSSLADVPLKQSLAVTGSVDQRGEIQPIGGVNEKIEGFFDICSAKGLTGDQGVVIPIQNVDNLMLKDEVLEAVKADKFHIYSVKTINEGIELLTGIPAGEPDKEGCYPEGTIFDLVDKKLKGFNEGLINDKDK
ncbi:MAG: Lon protease family protein [Solirubrobacterales bacterium]